MHKSGDNEVESADADLQKSNIKWGETTPETVGLVKIDTFEAVMMTMLRFKAKKWIMAEI